MRIKTVSFEKLLTDLVFLFLTGAVIGWGYEVLLHLFGSGEFVNRGMLHGPWLPIYGTGCVLMVLLKRWTGRKPLFYFFSCVAASGILEYVTSWAMEAIYHTRWWDYSNYALNLNGRVFLGGLLGFGAAGCVFVYLILPLLKKLYERIPFNLTRWIAIALALLFVLDVLLSVVYPNMGIGITKG